MNFEISERDEIIQLMRSIPNEYLIQMITDLIYKSDTFVYTKFINSIRCGDTTILMAPSMEDKQLLIKVVIEYLNMYTDKLECIYENNIKALVELYNEYNMTTINYESIPFIDILLLRSEDRDLWHMYKVEILGQKNIELIEELYKQKKPLPDSILQLVKIQMFVIASLYLDMDSLLVYLYKHALNEPEAL